MISPHSKINEVQLLIDMISPPLEKKEGNFYSLLQYKYKNYFSVTTLQVTMGIHGLSKLIADEAPGALKEREMGHFFNRVIAIDASMCLYQFLIAVRSDGFQLTTRSGDTTSHLMGIFYRTIRLMENGIKPVYVFDGKPPEQKRDELSKREDRRIETQKAIDKVNESRRSPSRISIDGDDDNAESNNTKDRDERIKKEINKLNRRLVKVTRTHVNEAIELLRLMGVPCINAESEAEATCAALVKSGEAFATATEDMDALTFGSPIVLRHMSFNPAKTQIKEYNYQQMLNELQLSREEFIDLCILMGCDYCASIKGIGPKRAIQLIRDHHDIETVLKKIDTSKYTIPHDWNYATARKLFISPAITNTENVELKWSAPNEDGIVKFLCGDREFTEERVRAGINKIKIAKATTQQTRIDSFFKIISLPKMTPLPSSKSKSNQKTKKNPIKKAKLSLPNSRKPK